MKLFLLMYGGPSPERVGAILERHDIHEYTTFEGGKGAPSGIVMNGSLLPASPWLAAPVVALDPPELVQLAVRARFEAGKASEAKELLMTGDLLSAQEAKDLGLINYAVPASDLDAKVDELVAKLLANPKWAVRWTKTVTNIPLRALAAQLMDASIGWESASNYLDDRREAVAAFKEKRKPDLTGN